MVTTIESINKNKRLSTQELLQKIYEAMNKGETEFIINACGQHDLGGPLWHDTGKTLKFTIYNPGQRVGSMCMENTEIIVKGSAPADVGWLNAGGTIIVDGDGGDTSAHCAAAGKIYVNGRVGARSGSLMKHDPKYEPPEFWVLKNTGSFSFEFMGGGIGVICGYDSDNFDSVLGDRACTGMVGGVVYVRGKVDNVYIKDVRIKKLENSDINFLKKGLKKFLASINRTKLEKELSNWEQWHKLVAKTYEETHPKSSVNIAGFRENDWVKNGIFSDVYPDLGNIIGLYDLQNNRQYYPDWLNHFYCAPCEYDCPISIPTQERYNLLREGRVQDAYNLIFDYSPFPGSICGHVCPNMCMDTCSRNNLDKAINIQSLGYENAGQKIEIKQPTKELKQKIAIIGAGIGGLTTAWHLRLKGYRVTVYEKEDNIGGKLAYAVSRERLDSKILNTELERLKQIGINFELGQEIDKKSYQKIKENSDAIILATGAYQAKLPPWNGRELIMPGLTFLKGVNTGKDMQIGKKVVVIGAGNTGMDIIFGAYEQGATKVTAIDIQKPAAFSKEIDHAKSLGAKIKWPLFVDNITKKGIKLTNGEFLEADTVILAIGEVPELDFISDPLNISRGYLDMKGSYYLSDKTYAIGDISGLGLFADAIGQGRELALIIDSKFNNIDFQPTAKKVIDKNKIVETYFQPEINKEENRCLSCGTCRDCRLCLDSCPEQAITRIQHSSKIFEYKSSDKKCIGCTICAAICPCGVWEMKDIHPQFPLDTVDVDDLGEDD